jgi:hypothetical protein
MPKAPSNKRRYNRHSYRIPCKFRVDGTDYRGFVTNISARGFFIQSNILPTEGGEVLVEIRTDPPMQIVGSIARRRDRHRELVAVDSAGLGVEVDSAPEAYYQLMMMLEDKSLARA